MWWWLALLALARGVDVLRLRRLRGAPFGARVTAPLDLSAPLDAATTRALRAALHALGLAP